MANNATVLPAVYGPAESGDVEGDCWAKMACPMFVGCRHRNGPTVLSCVVEHWVTSESFDESCSVPSKGTGAHGWAPCK